ncbi:G-protein coupled receptor dmsr-1 isoform X1 [Patella vulgata]|uniref:G-protein coupled receptor dmsr-1 isoform X1 n=1 Tax=Patella vulgata TaxID=6465 RepID=UPI00217FF6F4|nr:G-protein coupled receptor dmsr-1 isoform X1 [Patella vulgata]
MVYRGRDVLLECEDHNSFWYLENSVRCGPSADIKMVDRPQVNPGLENFSSWYSAFHGYASLCVCMSGILLNIFNVTVLTRKHMHTPVNHILTGLAISDITTMLSYVPFAIHFYCVYPTDVSTPEKNSIYWMTFLLFHINLTTVTHTISIWLCVSLSIIRFLHIRSPTRARSIRIARIKQSKYLVLLVYFASVVVMVPNYLTNELKPVQISNNETNSTLYVLESLRLGKNDTGPLVLINVWMYAVVAKLTPCLLITVFGCMLLYQMQVQVRKRRSIIAKFSGSSGIKLREHSRTTKMLISVIVLFIVTELPQGVLIVLSACKKNFFDTVYLPLGDIMDIVALVNNAVNFVLYCSMSTKFRETFLRQYCSVPKFQKADNGFNLREKFDSFSNNNQV